jgi:hypothetical protein
VQHYNAVAEIRTRDLEQLVDQLADHDAAAAPLAGGWAQVTITLPADTLRQAISTASALVHAAAGTGPVRRLEVLSTDDFDRRQGLQPVPELVSVTDAAASLGVSRQAVLQRLESGSLAGRKIGKTWVVPAAAVEH